MARLPLFAPPHPCDLRDLACQQLPDQHPAFCPARGDRDRAGTYRFPPCDPRALLPVHDLDSRPRPPVPHIPDLEPYLGLRHQPGVLYRQPRGQQRGVGLLDLLERQCDALDRDAGPGVLDRLQPRYRLDLQDRLSALLLTHGSGDVHGNPPPVVRPGRLLRDILLHLDVRLLHGDAPGGAPGDRRVLPDHDRPPDHQQGPGQDEEVHHPYRLLLLSRRLALRAVIPLHDRPFARAGDPRLLRDRVRQPVERPRLYDL
ncbi:hypothetical protein DSECCO2_602810 [anaerobic digester metagenome]